MWPATWFSATPGRPRESVGFSVFWLVTIIMPIETNVALHEASIGLSMSLWRAGCPNGCVEAAQKLHVCGGYARECL